jgi:hypothetical protein
MIFSSFGRRSLPLLLVLTACLNSMHGEEVRNIDPALRSPKKGIGFHGSAASKALPKLQVSWAYSWWHRSYGDVPKRTEFVPMILDGEVVNTDRQAIADAPSYGRFLLGFNEPDQGEPNRVSVDTAISLWPQFMATGMRLGSPAMAGQADLPDGWLGQFMRRAAEKGYWVDTVCVHAYLDTYEPEVATKKLRTYLEAIHARYQKPIWLTEFALANYWKKIPATEDEQIAFMAQALPMLESLPFIERYAWFHLGADHVDSLIKYAQLCDARGELTKIGRFYRDAVLRVPTPAPAKITARPTPTVALATPARAMIQTWRARLLERIRTQVASGKTITYPSPFLKQNCTILGFAAPDQLVVLLDHDSRFEQAWSMVDAREAAAIARALVVHQDAPSNAVAAFFALLSGDTVQGSPFLAQSGAETTGLRELFALDAVTVPTTGAPSAQP